MDESYRFEINHYNDKSIYISVVDPYRQGEVFRATIDIDNRIEIRTVGPQFDLAMILLRTAEAMLRNG